MHRYFLFIIFIIISNCKSYGYDHGLFDFDESAFYQSFESLSDLEECVINHPEKSTYEIIEIFSQQDTTEKKVQKDTYQIGKADGAKLYRAQLLTLSNFGIAYVGSLFWGSVAGISNPSSIVPCGCFMGSIIPGAFSTLMSLTLPNVSKNPHSPDYIGNAKYRQGYINSAMYKRRKNSILGGFVGLISGVVVAIFIVNQFDFQ